MAFGEQPEWALQKGLGFRQTRLLINIKQIYTHMAREELHKKLPRRFMGP